MDNRKFRDAMGKFATGITIVTTQYNGEIHGMTVNSFMSISLDPKLIAISIDEQASMYEILQASDTFGISVLKDSQEDLSKIFARQIKKDRAINYIIQDGVPVIDDTLAMISCQVEEKVKAGDHVIIIARVTDLTINEGDPVLFYGGNYRKIQHHS